MRTFLSQSRAPRGASRSHSSSGSSSSSSTAHNTHLCAMSPVTLVSITTAALLILTAPGCKSAPAEVAVTTDQRQLLSQIIAVCSSYLSAEERFWASDPLGELCVLMLFQKSKEFRTREIKRAEIQGPGGIQSRGYFLYRPRNGRRSLEYE